jgi:hypothetical protein
MADHQECMVATFELLKFFFSTKQLGEQAITHADTYNLRRDYKTMSAPNDSHMYYKYV